MSNSFQTKNQNSSNFKNPTVSISSLQSYLSLATLLIGLTILIIGIVLLCNIAYTLYVYLTNPDIFNDFVNEWMAVFKIKELVFEIEKDIPQLQIPGKFLSIIALSLAGWVLAQISFMIAKLGATIVTPNHMSKSEISKIIQEALKRQKNSNLT